MSLRGYEPIRSRYWKHVGRWGYDQEVTTGSTTMKYGLTLVMIHSLRLISYT